MKISGHSLVDSYNVARALGDLTRQGNRKKQAIEWLTKRTNKWAVKEVSRLLFEMVRSAEIDVNFVGSVAEPEAR